MMTRQEAGELETERIRQAIADHGAALAGVAESQERARRQLFGNGSAYPGRGQA